LRRKGGASTTLDRARHALSIIEKDLARDPYAGKPLAGKYKGLLSPRFADFRIVYEGI
jgi:hypothetical protein